MRKPWERRPPSRNRKQITHLRCLKCAEWIPVEQVALHEKTCVKGLPTRGDIDRLSEALAKRGYA